MAKRISATSLIFSFFLPVIFLYCFSVTRALFRHLFLLFAILSRYLTVSADWDIGSLTIVLTRSSTILFYYFTNDNSCDLSTVIRDQ